MAGGGPWWSVLRSSKNPAQPDPLHTVCKRLILARLETVWRFVGVSGWGMRSISAGKDRSMALLREFEGSGLFIAEFCRRREVGYSSRPGHALLLNQIINEGSPQIVQRPFLSGLRPMIIMVIRRLGELTLTSTALVPLCPAPSSPS